MYTAGTAGYNPAQAQMMQMQMMNGGMGGMGGMGAGMGLGMMGGLGMGGMNNNFFLFVGNSLSLQSRLDSLTDADAEKLVDANINVTGTQIQTMNMWSYMCTIIWGSIIILPLFFICCDWWKRCTFPAFDISPAVYMSLAKIFRAPNVKNVTLTVNDSTFDGNKANILYNLLAESRLRGFTFINGAGAFDFNGRENSDFVKNMRPIKMLNNVISDMRWGTEIVM